MQKKAKTCSLALHQGEPVWGLFHFKTNTTWITQSNCMIKFDDSLLCVGSQRFIGIVTEIITASALSHCIKVSEFFGLNLKVVIFMLLNYWLLLMSSLASACKNLNVVIFLNPALLHVIHLSLFFLSPSIINYQVIATQQKGRFRFTDSRFLPGTLLLF